MADEQKQDLVAKVVGMGATFAAAWLTQKIIGRAWRMVVGHEPPKPEEEGDVSFREVALAAVITGAAAYLSRVLAQRGTAKLLKR